MVQKLTMFNWDDIRIFLALSRSGSIRAAARTLGTTHATVSRRVKSIERELGGTLFERTPDGARLSDLGQSVLPVAESVEAGISQLDRLVFADEKRLAGPVRLSVSDNVYHFLLHDCLKVFHEKHPQIELNITVSDEMSDLSRREADIAIRISNSPPLNAYGRKLADSPLTPYASKKYLNARPKLDKWISLTYKPAEMPVLPARIIAKSDSLMVVREMVSDDMGIAMMPCFAGDSDDSLRRVPGFLPVPDNQIWALVHADVRKNPRVRVLLDHIYETFDALRPRIEGHCPASVEAS